jgi:hydroxypyruvate isomerase
MIRQPQPGETDDPMTSYAANLTMLYNEVPFLERFERAAAAGFRAVEFPFIHPGRERGGAIAHAGLEFVLFDPEGGDSRRRPVLRDPACRDHLFATVRTR